MCVCVCVCVCARARVCVCVWDGGYWRKESVAGAGEQATLTLTRRRACPPAVLQPPGRLFAALAPRCLQFNTPAVCSRYPLICRPYPQGCAITTPAVHSQHP